MSTSLSPSSSSSPRSASSTDSALLATPRVSSPLNPATITPTNATVPLPPSDASNLPANTRRPRGRSTSELNEGPDPKTPTVHVTSAHGDASALSLPDAFKEGMNSTFRDRSRSPARGSNDQIMRRPGSSVNPAKSMTSSWWGEGHVSRPWHDSPRRKKTVPPEQIEALESTRKKVAQAVSSALDTAADVAHEALYIGVEFLDLAPIPGLQSAAKMLLNIWDASQQVDMNRLGCLRLTQRCADILISVRQEIYDAGDTVGQELEAPITKLEESFVTVYTFLIKQTNRPFLKRYLKRDEILRDISGCDMELRDALGLFSIKIQIRILKQVQEAEKRRQEETQALLNAIMSGRMPPPTSDLKGITVYDVEEDNSTSTGERPMIRSNKYSYETITHFTTTENALGLINTDGPVPSTPNIPPSDILPALASLHSMQNSLDAARDLADLRQLMRAALQTSSDAQMLEVLQIGRQEMPDAIKTLQRALERVAERDGDGVEALPGKGVVVGNIVKHVSLRDVQSGNTSLKRSTTVISVESLSSSSGGSASGSSSDMRKRDTLDWEFIESGIDALRRMSRGLETSLPSWTITKYEVDRDEKIGIGFFSDVYKGTWRGRTVAIKVLAESTPRKLFMREIGIWKTLHHINVLPLYGASSTTGDPPWFFVSAYLKNGSLVEYLKRIEMEERPNGLGVGLGAMQLPYAPLRSPGGRAGTIPPSPWRGILAGSPRDLTPPSPRGKTPPRDNNVIHRDWDLFRFMYEIAKGMEYLHSHDVLHGDLKAANVLVDDKFRCVISDFGQSEMKSEAYRISGTPPPHGTLRWQSPELMAGQSQLTPEIDVWAFSICCVEILTMGRMPWPLMDDEAVRHFVLKENSRPPIPPNSRFNTPGLQDILQICWNANPNLRPKFAKIVRDLKQLRKNAGQEVFESPRAPLLEELSEHTSSPSPDMRPIDLPRFLQDASNPLPKDILVGSIGSDTTFHTARDTAGSPNFPDVPRQESTVSTEDVKMPEPVIYTPGPSSRTSSIFIPSSHSDEHVNLVDYDGYDSPPPMDERIANLKNERRYRLLLTHDYHPSLTLPLWDPSPVELGVVGYLSKPRGEFITLFNALSPHKAVHPGIRSLPSIHGYASGKVPDGSQRQDRRTVTQRGMDVFAGLLQFRNFSQNVSRRYSFPLKAGHKTAYLCAETTVYRYLESLEAPKKWFQGHADTIMQIYGHQHHLQKEDLFLVIGTLNAPNYALFVSHSHPEGHAHFNVYSTPKSGQPWGMFTTDTEVPRELGPLYDDEPGDVARLSASKVSSHGGPWDTVLMARLRFKPDVLEPTSK
ncbi:hypothetical protein B0H34DRAFT_738281 [Crassisporium funariophilum]|nr:hypothetical protein B0H34DRAFT_738281 [Crassisporium funariophilum]